MTQRSFRPVLALPGGIAIHPLFFLLALLALILFFAGGRRGALG
ncbi:MAG TPA: hypothetical protein VGW98_12805 [Solirubrobacteraceae bacterium]|jgi:hypothetical protein|nr:hypothetical protein [Solirubrobacteraceae bacterium]